MRTLYDNLITESTRKLLASADRIGGLADVVSPIDVLAAKSDALISPLARLMMDSPLDLNRSVRKRSTHTVNPGRILFVARINAAIDRRKAEIK